MLSSEVTEALTKLVTDRNWDRFHTPENLAKSVAIEAGELLECFQWKPADPNMQDVKYELADVLTYCYHLARRMGWDPEEIVMEKLEVTKRKYPVEKCVEAEEIRKHDQL